MEDDHGFLHHGVHDGQADRELLLAIRPKGSKANEKRVANISVIKKEAPTPCPPVSRHPSLLPIPSRS